MPTAAPARARSVTYSKPECLSFATELGSMAVAWQGGALLRVSLGHASEAAAAASLADLNAAATAKPPRFLADLVRRLQAYAAGTNDDFSDVPLDLSHLSEFQQRVVSHCRQIPIGRTLTYGQLAAKSGSAKAARAVGSVMSRNRFPIIVPCHRVVGSAGSLGGFSAPDGISTKVRILAREGVTVSQTFRKAK